MTKLTETLDFAIVSNNALFARNNLQSREEAAQKAIHNLAVMAHNGELQLPEPWTTATKKTRPSWTEEDGTVLDCYLDMLGLNGRQLKDCIRST